MLYWLVPYLVFFFFQAEDGIRDLTVTGVQTCALPISRDAAEGRRLVDSARELLAGAALGGFAAPEHTTIGVVATNARLDRAQAATLASLGMLGFAKALSPPHTAFDGDTLFALSVGNLPAEPSRLGLAAADAVARAICRGARAAVSLPHLPAARDL